MKNVKYSDMNTQFDIHPIKKDLLVVRDENAVKNAVKNLLLTGPYERRFRPTIASGLQKYLFEPVSPTTAGFIRTSIIKTIQTYEPRAELQDVNVQVNPDGNSYSATVSFRIINRSEVITFSTILTRVR